MRTWLISCCILGLCAVPVRAQTAEQTPEEEAAQNDEYDADADGYEYAADADNANEDEIEEVVAVEEVADRDSPARWWDDGNPHFDRAVNLHYAAVTRKSSLRFIIDHRTNQAVDENPFHDFLGFDAGALKIGLGLRYGVWDNLDVGFYRLNSGTERFDVYEFDAKYHLLHQERHFVELGLRAGITWFSQDGAEDAVGGLAQLLLSRRFFDRLTLGTGLLFHSDSTNDVKSNLDDDWSLALMWTVDVRILRWLAWQLELAYSVAGYGTRDKEGIDTWPVINTAVEFITHRHTFQLVVSNTPYTSADGYVSNSRRDLGELVVGFSITREWNL